jgi:hypothetical protein
MGIWGVDVDIWDVWRGGHALKPIYTGTGGTPPTNGNVCSQVTSRPDSHANWLSTGDLDEFTIQQE